MKVEVADLGPPSPIILMVSVDVKEHRTGTRTLNTLVMKAS